jgi:branched-subunit amino acid transport protein AzlD
MKMDWITFWIAALATYRITVLISRCLGPFHIFRRLRENFYLGKWARCPYCVSPYAAALVCVTLFSVGVKEPIGVFLLLVFCFSGVAIILDRTFSSDYQT